MSNFDPISYDKAEKAIKHSKNVQEQLNQVKNDFIQHKLDYAELNLKENHVIRKLSSEVKDEVFLNDITGEYEILKKTGYIVLDGNLDWAEFNQTQANTYRMGVHDFVTTNNVLSIHNKTAFSLAQEINGDANYRVSATGDVFDMGTVDERAIGLYPINNQLLVRIEKSKVDAMEGATGAEKFKAYLNKYPIVLIYQLAEPEIISFPEVLTPNAQLIVELIKEVNQLSDGLTEFMIEEGSEW